MLIKPVNYSYIQSQSQRKSACNSAVSFKQVTPEHFYIRMLKYEKNCSWGEFVSNLVNNSKKLMLTPKSNLKKSFFSLAEKYKKFMAESEPYLKFGRLKKPSDKDLYAIIYPDWKYCEYFQKAKRILNTNSKTLSDVVINTGRKFKTCQIQNEVDGKNIVLTQLAYRYNLDGVLSKDLICLIHPPIETGEVLLNKAETYHHELKSFRKKPLTKDDITQIYEKIGAIHWCIAQGMPFQRGSAALADMYTKGLFESLNIQTTRWKKGLAPDLEAFFTPLEEYSKKYRSFFEPPLK